MKKNDLIKKRVVEYCNQFKEVIKDLKNKDTRKKQLPNLLTLSRGIAVLLIAPIAISGNFLLAAIITGISALTDALDGKLARKWNVTSEFGKYSDAIVDKLFACSLLLTIAFKIDVAYFVPLFMELGIGTVNIIVELNDSKAKSSLVGKAKTWVLFSTIALNYLAVYIKISPEIINSFFTLTVASQAVTFGTYMNKLPSEQKNNEFVNDNILKTELFEGECEDDSKLKKIENQKQQYISFKEVLDKEINRQKNVEQEINHQYTLK